MDDKIIEFVGVLRKNGIRVSAAESIDALSVLEEIPLSERGIVKDALRGALVKRRIDVRPFDELFDLFFSELGEALGDPADDLATRLIQGGTPELENFSQMLQEVLDEMSGDLSKLTEALLKGDRAQIERMIREAAEKSELGEIQNVLQIGMVANKIRQALNLDGVEADIEKLKERLRGKGMPQDVLDKAFAQIEARLEKLREAVREYVQRRLVMDHYDELNKMRDERLMSRPLYQLTVDDIRRMRDVVERLVERLKSLVQIKRRRLKRGKFDVKKTIRKNMQHGGVPFQLVFNDRVIDKPDIVVLCDISDSVRNASRFFLQFVYSLQEIFHRVRSFVFVSELGEATKLFQEFEISQAIEKALWGDVINTYSHSNYGLALDIFYRDHFSSIREGKTHVIVIGDGRNNYNKPNEWVLKEIQNKAKSVIWLNPEGRSNWGYGDSEMLKYVPYLDKVHHCSSLDDLAKVIDELVLQ